MQAVMRHLSHRYADAAKPPAGDVFDVWAADGREMQMERAHAPVARRILDQISFAADAWYLDIGCGNGYTVRWVAGSVTRGRAIGIDASPRMIHRARELSQSCPRTFFHAAVFPHHDLPYASFDVIFSMETLYYLSDLHTGLAEIRHLLKPGGMVLSAVDYYRENKDSHGWTGYVGTPMKLLSARAWRRAFRGAGFAPVWQERVVLAPDQAVESWHAKVGSLLTAGRRPL
jgi:SAM-dependent methyltransferase